MTTPPALARQWTSAVSRALDRARERRFGWGGRFGAETRASAEAAFGRLAESATRIGPRALAAAAVILLFWLVARALRWALSFIFRRIIEDVTVESLIKQLPYYAILALGFFVAVDALGFDTTKVAVGIGLTGVVLEITFWTDSRRADYKNTASAVREAAVQAFKDAGIGLPEPDVRLLRPQQVDKWREALAAAPETAPEARSQA